MSKEKGLVCPEIYLSFNHTHHRSDKKHSNQVLLFFPPASKLYAVSTFPSLSTKYDCTDPIFGSVASRFINKSLYSPISRIAVFSRKSNCPVN